MMYLLEEIKNLSEKANKMSFGGWVKDKAKKFADFVEKNERLITVIITAILLVTGSYILLKGFKTISKYSVDKLAKDAVRRSGKGATVDSILTQIGMALRTSLETELTKRKVKYDSPEWKVEWGKLDSFINYMNSDGNLKAKIKTDLESKKYNEERGRSHGR